MAQLMVRNVDEAVVRHGGVDVVNRFVFASDHDLIAAELVASAGADLTGNFLWQEVLQPMGEEQRRLLAVLCDIGGGDDALLSTALDARVAFEPSVPLIAVDADGWDVRCEA